MSTARNVDLVANLLQQGVREPHAQMKQRGRSTARRHDSAMARVANRLPVDRKVLERRGFQPLGAMCQGATSPPPVAPFNAVLRSGSRGVVASMPRLFGARSVVHSSTPAEDVMGIPFPYARHLDNQRRSVPGEAAHCRRL